MSIIIDIVIVAILLLCIFLGYKRGLASSVLNILSFILAIIIAILLYKPVSDWVIQNTQIDETIENAIIESLSRKVNEEGNISEEATDLPTDMVNYINGAIQDVATEAKDTALVAASHQISMTIIQAGVAIIVFILAKVILMVVKLLTKFVTNIPIIKQVNEIGGLIYGVLQGVTIIWILLALISLISPMIQDGELLQNIQKAAIGNFFYENNLLLKWLF